MPIRRLRSLDDEENLWIAPGDPRLWRTIATVWELARRLSPPRFPPGVYKHRSIDECARAEEGWDAERVRRSGP